LNLGSSGRFADNTIFPEIRSRSAWTVAVVVSRATQPNGRKIRRYSGDDEATDASRYSATDRRGSFFCQCDGHFHAIVRRSPISPIAKPWAIRRLSAPIKGRKLAAGPQKGGPIGPPGFRRLARTAGLPRYRRG